LIAELLVERGAQAFIARCKSQHLDRLERELAMQAQRALDHDLPIADRRVGKELRLGRLLEVEEGATNAPPKRPALLWTTGSVDSPG
jgi:hypothetical protein